VPTVFLLRGESMKMMLLPNKQPLLLVGLIAQHAKF
jgi:hypothetical protein